MPGSASPGLPRTQLRTVKGLLDPHQPTVQCTQGASQHYSLPLSPPPVVAPEEIVLELQFVAALNLRAVRK